MQDHQSVLARMPRVRRSKFKGLHIIGLACMGFLLILFQNCEFDTVSTSKTPQQPGNSEASSSLSYEKGQAIAYLPSEGEGMPKDRFDINAGLYLKMGHVHPDADHFKWTITRGFESIVDSQTTNKNEYQHRFTQTGSYMLFATAHQGSSSDLLTKSVKRIVIGAECQLDSVLEIALQSGSFTSDSSVVLTLRDVFDFTDITWKVISPSGQSERIFNGATLTVDLTGELGSLVIEVSAVDSNGCLVYRKKEVQITENLQPYINPFQITDDGQEIAVVLENNDIYKYRRPRGNTQTLNLDIRNANRCEFQLNNRSRSSINCQDAIDISLSSNEECQRTLFKIWTSSRDQTDSSYQYYNYCPANDDICYFGSLKESIGQHFCSESIALVSREDDQRPDLTTDRSIDGQCDNSIRNGCLAGDADDAVIADTEEFYKWHCVGVNNGKTVIDCHKRIPINGQCDNSKKNGCLLGQFNDAVLEDSEEFYKWHCEGEHGGTTATDCQKDKPLNGACNNNVKNGCSAGTPNPTAVADTDTHYKWQCDGQHGGQNSDTCQKRKPINGQCKNATKNGCLRGTANIKAIADTGTHYRWRCDGQHGGRHSGTCQFIKPIDGQCKNATKNGCLKGRANEKAIADTGTHYRWRCDGQHGGRNSSTCQIRKPINGQCKNAYRNGCLRGLANERAIPDTSTHHRWRCDGQHGGRNSGTCQIRKPINGQCNNSLRNGCRTGRANDKAIPDDAYYYVWRCDGQYGGHNSSTCYKRKPINGQCNNANKNGCLKGRANEKAIADISTHYRWRCDGMFGGRNSRTCLIKKPPPKPKMAGKIVQNCRTNPNYNACIYSASRSPNYAVNITDNVGSYLENSHYKVKPAYKYGKFSIDRAILRNGKWKISNVAVMKNGKVLWIPREVHQTTTYYWLMYQRAWMKLNAGGWYAEDKEIIAESPKNKKGTCYNWGGCWSPGDNTIVLNAKYSLNMYVIMHEAGHANLTYAKKQDTGLIQSRDSRYYMRCEDFLGCYSAINEGQASFYYSMITLRRPMTSRCIEKKTAPAMFQCSKGQIHNMGYIYNSIWYEVYMHPQTDSVKIARLFHNHLPLLAYSDNFADAGLKILNLAKQMKFSNKVYQIIGDAFVKRGLMKKSGNKYVRVML